MKEDNLLTAAEVSVLVGISIYTLNNWYRFKKQKPKDKYAKMLPKFVQKTDRQTRYWKREDIPKLIEFKTSIPKGVSGVMGVVTQKYYKKEEKKNERNYR